MPGGVGGERPGSPAVPYPDFAGATLAYRLELGPLSRDPAEVYTKTKKSAPDRLGEKRSRVHRGRLMAGFRSKKPTGTRLKP